MPPAEDRWTIKKLMIVIAIIALLLYSGTQIVQSYIWMIKAGW